MEVLSLKLAMGSTSVYPQNCGKVLGILFFVGKMAKNLCKKACMWVVVGILSMSVGKCG